MVEIVSDDYHDFVIRDGRLIGEFDQMYKKSRQVPWHQDEQETWLDIRLTIDLLQEYGPFDAICDFVSGLGYFLDIVSRKIGKKECILTGYDISETCCEKARSIFPHIVFHQLDLMDNVKIHPEITDDGKKNRLFMIRGTLWYVFPSISNVVQTIAQNTVMDDYLLISQNFPPLNSDFVGKGTIPDPESLINYFQPYFMPIRTIYLEDKVSKCNDNWFIGFFRRR